MAAQRLHDACITEVQKIKKLKKSKKHGFLKFFIRVKSNTCKKWGIGSIYTPL
jgi:hypothetical protein